jgi:hypothetical protein
LILGSNFSASSMKISVAFSPIQVSDRAQNMQTEARRDHPGIPPPLRRVTSPSL